MANLVYTRVSTDEQSTQRQTHLLAEAGLRAGAEGVRIFSDPATSSKIAALQRSGFLELAGFARPGDTVTVSELYRLCRDLSDILAVRNWCQQHEVKLRVLSGALSGITDLAATDATTTMLVNVLVSVGQFHRDLQNELTRDGLAAAWAAGSVSGRRPRITQLGAEEAVRQAFRDGASIAALAREHQVSRGAIRTALADLLPNQAGRVDQGNLTDSVAAEAGVVRVEIPGKIAQHLNEHTGLDQAPDSCHLLSDQLSPSDTENEPAGTGEADAPLGASVGVTNGARAVSVGDVHCEQFGRPGAPLVTTFGLWGEKAAGQRPEERSRTWLVRSQA